ncbi:MAG: TIM barrel protein [Proteobacteria bacterium]|nr:TIM barrel protein [Pseudomonadota bacterium]
MMNFGVSGFPLAFTTSAQRKKRENIFPWLHAQGLNALELQMTYGPRTSEENCLLYNQLSQEFGIKLSAHASYFIVLTSAEAEKIERSIETLKRTYELAEILGADAIVLHPGPLYGQPAADAHERFLANCAKFLSSYGPTPVGLFVETAGKHGQLGTVDEILSLSAQLPGVHPCIDFGHVHAHTGGTLEDPANVGSLVQKLTTFVTQSPTRRIHFHYTPIDYGPRGEIRHRAVGDAYPVSAQPTLFAESRPRYQSSDGLYHPLPANVAPFLHQIPVPATLISETYNSQEQGAAAIQQAYLAAGAPSARRVPA